MMTHLLLLLTLFNWAMPREGLRMETRIEKFIHIVEGKEADKIEISYEKDLIVGTLYGTDKLTNGTVIYYKSILRDLKIDQKHIQFNVTSYSFSTTPFEGKKGEGVQPFDKDLKKLPALLKFPQNFSGSMSSAKLKLRRTSSSYDSRYDELIFIKVN